MLLQRGLLCSGDVHLLPDHGHRLRAGCLSISPGWVHAGKPSSIFPAGAVWASMGYSYWRPSLKRYIHTLIMEKLADAVTRIHTDDLRGSVFAMICPASASLALGFSGA